jgi:CRP-like cAMP-binding protein
MTSDAHEVWIRGIERATPLDEGDRQILRGIPLKLRRFEPRSDIVREGENPEYSCVLVDGLAWRYKVTGSGARQILSMHVPGETPDLQNLHLRVMDHTLASVTRCDVGLIMHHHLRDVIQRYPHVTEALWRSTLIDASIFREWLVGLGARTAYQRIAHFLCEMGWRIRYADGELTSYALPLTQMDLGDTLGISTVHVNRVLRDLREAKLAAFDRGMVQIIDSAGLQRAADFDPSYLHLGYTERVRA